MRVDWCVVVVSYQECSFTHSLTPRTTLGTGLARTGTNTHQKNLRQTRVRTTLELSDCRAGGEASVNS